MQNSQIDFVLLRVDTTKQEVELLCSTAHVNRYGSVCVPPIFAQTARSYLSDTDVQICSVVSFPMGYVPNRVKLLEITEAIENGVHEVEVVPNLGNVHTGNWKAVETEFKECRKITEAESIALTVIFEIDLWDESKIKELCNIAADTGVDFIKTSTDTLLTPIAPKKIQLLAQQLVKSIDIKASGKIQTRAEAVACWEAGASRVCTTLPL